MISIPNILFDKFNEAIDACHTAFGESCTLVFPPKKVTCSNCVTANFPGGVSRNVYRHGGPAPFTFGVCPLCGGNGYKEEETTSTIVLRIYWERNRWLKVANINLDDCVVQVAGLLSDIDKFKRAQEIILVNKINQIEYRCALLGTPELHGFRKNRYFVAMLRQV